MTYRRRGKYLCVLIAALLILTLGTAQVFADQPNRGTTKHKNSLRNADIGRVENTYTDLNGETQDTDKNTVSISFTSDMEQDMDLYARAATYFDDESKHYPRSFMIDGGNYSDGTPYNSVFAQYYPGVRIMGAAKYDVAGIGSSELKQGGVKLVQMLTKAAKSDATLPYLTSANIAGTNDLEDAFKAYGVNDYLDINKYRTELGIFSIVGEDAFNAAAPDKLRYEDAIDTAKKVVKEIKKDEDTDLIICLCASGIGTENSDKKFERKIAGSVDGIDIIISVGSKTELEKPIEVNGTKIVSLAGGSGKVGRIEYTIENNQYKYSNFETIELTDKYKRNGEVVKRLEEISKTANKNYFAANGYASGQVLCQNYFNIAPLANNAGRRGDCPLGELIADAYRYGATEDAKIPKGNLIAVSSDKSAKAGIEKGKVTVNSIYDMMKIGKSADGTKGQALTTFYLTGADVRVLAEIAATAADDPDAVRLYFSGLNYKYNPHRFKDSRIYDLTVLDDATGSQIELSDDAVCRIIADNETAGIISMLSLGDKVKVNVVPKDENGIELTDFGELNRSMYKGKPLKSWIAMSEYLTTFQEAGIPATYKKADGRMVYDDSKAFSHVYKGQFFVLVQLLMVALIGIVALIVLVLLILNLAGVNIRKKHTK